MTVLALILDVVGCLVAGGVVRVWQILDDDSWREDRW
jgi:hypothetical protein